MPPRLRKKSKVQAASRDESEPNVPSTPRIIDLSDDPVSPPSPDIRPRSLLSRRSISSLRDRVAKGVVRGGKIMRGGFANIGEGFSRITEPAGTRRNVSDPLRSSPTGSQESDDHEHHNETPDQLSPLLGSTPVKRGLRDRLKRARKSDTPSDSDGSLSGGSQGQARKNAAASTRPVSEMGVLRPRVEQQSPAVVEPAEERSAVQASDSGVEVPVRDAPDQAGRTRASDQRAYLTPPPTEPSTSPPRTTPRYPPGATPHYPPGVERDTSASPLPPPPTFSSLLTPPVTPERPGSSEAVAAHRDKPSPSPQDIRPMQLSTHAGSSLDELRDSTAMEVQASELSQQIRLEDWQAGLEDRQAWLKDRQAWLAERQAWRNERQALLAERDTLVSRLKDLAAASPGAMAGPEQPQAAEAGVEADARPPPRSAAELLEDVRQSFMKMAPMALEASGLYEADASWERLELSVDQIVEMWSKIWASFDFTQPQKIDLSMPWDRQPQDLQILFAALGCWTRFHSNDQHGIRDLVQTTAFEWDNMNKNVARARIEEGLDRLEKFIQFNRALRPQDPSGLTTSTPVPFPWLDVRLSHFQHLGWKFLYQPLGEEEEPIDYNDFQSCEDPRANFFLNPEDHFRDWREGGLLMTDVRVPLPRHLLGEPLELGGALRALYSVEHHPLCLLGQAWEFARQLCITPTDADLRAAMLYQVIFRIHANGSSSWREPWGTWAGDKTLDKLNWPSQNPAPRAYLSAGPQKPR